MKFLIQSSAFADPCCIYDSQIHKFTLGLAMSAKIIDGKRIASEYKQEIKSEIDSIVAQGHRAPCLAVILVGNDPASEVYVGHKKKACSQVGIESKSVELSAETTQEELSNVLRELNSDDSVDGILLQLPLPKHLDSAKAIDLIAPAKDVDGLTTVNQGLLVWKRDGLRSCTPFGIMKLLEKENISVVGKDVCVLGRSVLVGAPIATMLSNAGATLRHAILKQKTAWPSQKELTY